MQGVFSSRGEKILMADADGATKFPDVEKLEKGLNDLQPWPVSIRVQRKWSPRTRGSKGERTRSWPVS